MTTADLHKILDDEKRKLSLDELKQVIYELKQDCFKEQAVLLDDYSNKRCGERHYIHTNAYYMGEKNAFQIALDLLEHFCENKIDAKYKVGDTVYYIRVKGFGKTTKEAGEPIIAQGIISRVYKGKTRTTYYVRDRKMGLEENRLYADKADAEKRLLEIREMYV